MTTPKRLLIAGSAVVLLTLATALHADVPSPEKLLPEDTLVLLTAPDFARVRELSAKSPQAQLWNDPAMKPFKDKFLTKWDEEVVKPLERELDVKFADHTSLLQGQVTFAITQDDWKGQDGTSPGIVFLVDAKDKSDLLKKDLAALRKKWVDAGKPLKTEKIRDVEFIVLRVSSNDVPKTVRKLFPKSSQVQELGTEQPATKAPEKNELVLGQADSLFIIGNSVKAVEKIVVRLKGGSMPSLSEFALYQANHQAMFRDAPLYGWVNSKRFIDVLLPVWSEKKENPDAPNPFDLQPEKVLNALGLTGLKTIAFSLQQANDGSLYQLFFGVPEANRQGLFKIIAGEPKEASPPAFVPADALKFQRWRIDGRKAWATLEKTVGEVSPQGTSTLNSLLDLANTYAREKDPGFDIRKNLIANLGDDIITYKKPAHGTSLAEIASPPSLFLLASPNPEQLIGALKGVLGFMSQSSGTTPSEREFLGRKINSVPLAIPGRPPGGGDKATSLHYTSSNGYIALSTDAGMIEEYLRTCDTQPKPLRELSGLADAAQKVTGTSSSLFGYQNDAESMRATFETLKKTFGQETNATASPSLLPLAASLGGVEKIFKEWLDVSQLPAFDKVSKYFSFSVYGGSATVDGLAFKMFSPLPPGLKH